MSQGCDPTATPNRHADAPLRYELPQKWLLPDLDCGFHAIANQDMSSDWDARQECWSWQIFLWVQGERDRPSQWACSTSSSQRHFLWMRTHSETLKPEPEVEEGVFPVPHLKLNWHHSFINWRKLHFSRLAWFHLLWIYSLTFFIRFYSAFFWAEQALVEVEDHRPLALRCLPEEKTELGPTRRT